MSDEPCDCGWCGNCREQLDHQRALEERSDYREDDEDDQ